MIDQVTFSKYECKDFWMKCCREEPVKTEAGVGGECEVGVNRSGPARGAGEAAVLPGVRSIPDGGARAKIVIEDPQLANGGQGVREVIREGPTCRYLYVDVDFKFFDGEEIVYLEVVMICCHR